MTPLSTWFRLYTEILDDPKIQKLPCETLKMWLNLLCLTSKYDGSLPACNDIAFALRITESEATTTVSHLLEIGLLDKRGNKIAPHNWDARQYKSDSSTERVKRFRKRPRNVSVTPPEQNRTEQTPKVPTDFDRFWEAYPKKRSKGAAIKAWSKNGRPDIERPDIERLLVVIAVARTSRDWLRESGQFIPNPATWLNGKCWDDDYGQPKPAERKVVY